MQKRGFTLIELLVVIVIIGILATISVATFSGYFKKARDAERQTTIRNAATLLKTARAVESIDSFGDTDSDGTATTTAQFLAVLASEGGYKIGVDGTTTDDYQYQMVIAGDDFAIYNCSEETAGTVFVDGTADAITDVRASQATICADGAINYTTAVDADGDGTDETPFKLED